MIYRFHDYTLDEARRELRQREQFVAVAVGEVGGESPYGHLALGVTPNLAAKIQGMAAPGSLVISAAMYCLVQGYFVCQDLGPHSVPGVTEPLPLRQVLHASAARAVGRGVSLEFHAARRAEG